VYNIEVKFENKFVRAYKLIPILTKNQLEEYFPSAISKLFLFLAHFLLLLPVKLGLLVVPKRFCYLIASIASNSSKKIKARYFIYKIENYFPSNKLVVHFQLSDQPLKNVSHLNQDQYFGNKSLETGKFEHLLSWGMWNYSHKHYIDLLYKAIAFLNDATNSDNLDSIRYLPEFTSNLGHLGFLTSYIGHYSKETPERVIGIWPNQSPNQFLMKLILEQSPLKIKTFSSTDNIKDLKFIQKDNLALSLMRGNNWRIEHCSGAYSGQAFPEIKDGFKLKFPEHLWEQSLDKLKSIGFDKNKWFVALHIRGPRTTALDSIQVRDADVESYREFCHAVNDLGGQVIRMGGKFFNKLSDKFPALDYAHSSINSPELDCWLWANCKWWTGNPNGAMAAAYAFGARRLITDQWFWDNLGCNDDFYIPRLVKKGTRYLSIEDTLNLELSRCMVPSKFKEINYQVPNLESKILSRAAIDLYNRVFNRSKSNNRDFMKIEEKFNLALKNNQIGQTMRIPESYQNYILNSQNP